MDRKIFIMKMISSYSQPGRLERGIERIDYIDGLMMSDNLISDIISLDIYRIR